MAETITKNFDFIIDSTAHAVSKKTASNYYAAFRSLFCG